MKIMQKTKTIEELLPPEAVKALFNHLTKKYCGQNSGALSEKLLDEIIDDYVWEMSETQDQSTSFIKFRKGCLSAEVLEKDYIQDIEKELLAYQLRINLYTDMEITPVMKWRGKGFYKKNQHLSLPEYLSELENDLSKVIKKINGDYVKMHNTKGFLKQLPGIVSQSQDRSQIHALFATAATKHPGGRGFDINNLFYEMVSRLEDAWPSEARRKREYKDFFKSVIADREILVDSSMKKFAFYNKQIGIGVDSKGKNWEQCLENAKKIIDKAKNDSQEGFIDRAFKAYTKMQIKDSITKSSGHWIKRTRRTSSSGKAFFMYSFMPRRFNDLFWGEASKSGFDFQPLAEERVYHVNSPGRASSLQPDKILASCIDDYLAAVSALVGADNGVELKKIEFARRFFAQDKDLVLDHYLGALYKNTRNGLRKRLSECGLEPCEDGRFSEEKLPLGKLKEKIELRYGNPGVRTFSNYMHALALDELSLLVSAKSNGKSVPDAITRMREVVEKFKPGEYTDVFECDSNKGKRYTIKITSDHNLVKRAAMSTNESCIRRELASQFKEWVSDPGTIYLVGYQNGRLRGYTRLFLMNKQDRASGSTTPLLALDTIEPPRKDFHKYQGFVNAMGLAALQLSLDINASEFIGEDGRIKFGIRQAYSNTQKDYTLRKLGRTSNLRTYCFSIFDSGKAGIEYSAHLIMKNWRYKPKQAQARA